MLNFPKNQCHALPHTERRENAPPADDETTTINNRLIQGPRLESPEQHQPGTPLSAPVKPAVTVPDPAPASILPVTPPVTLPGTSFSLPLTSSLPVWRQPGHAHPVAFGRGEPSETGRRLQNIAKQVSDAQQPVLEEVKDAIRDVKLHSLPSIVEWLQFCGILCLHYDEQEDKEQLSQCLEQVLLRISALRCASDPAHFKTAKASLLATSIPAGFIHVIQRARESKWQNGRLNSLIQRAKIATTVKRALEQLRAGKQPEKIGQQAATELMPARHAAHDASANWSIDVMRQAKAMSGTPLLQSDAQPRPYGYVPRAYWQPTAMGSTDLPSGAALAAAVPMPFQRTSEPPMPVYISKPIKPPRQAIVAPIEAIIESSGHKRLHIDEPVERKRQRIGEDGSSTVDSASSIEILGVTWPPMSARDRAHLKNIEMAFSAYEDVLSQEILSMSTLLTTFDELRRVTHDWIVLLASRPAAAHLLVTLSTITASWQSQTKTGLPAEIDANSFNITIDLPPAQTRVLSEWSYENNPVLTHGKRRAPGPHAGGDAADIDSRPAKRPRLASPRQNQPGEPRVDSITPVVRVLDPAPPAQSRILPPVAQPSLPLSNEYEPPRDLVRLLKPRRHGSMGTNNATPTSTVTHSAAPSRADLETLQSARQLTKKENVVPVDDERFESISRQVRDAEQVDLQLAIITIQEGGVNSPAAVAVWLQFCAVLCLHYDDQQDKEPLWQCLERIFLRIRCIKQKCEEMRIRYDTAQATLLPQSMPAGFIRILQLAKASKWREGRLLVLFSKAGMSLPLTLAIEQTQAGQHPEKTAQQAAADFLLAHYPARAAHTALPAHTAGVAVPEPPGEINRFETVNPEFLFMPFFGEDMVDPGPLPEFWWLPDGDNPAAHTFEPAGGTTSTTTTTTPTTPTPAVTHTAPQLRAAPDAPLQDGLVADVDNERAFTEYLLND
jgi:hypothetical protein